MVAYLAEALAFFGHTGSRDARRTQALVLMAHPFAACLLIARRASAAHPAAHTAAHTAAHPATQNATQDEPVQDEPVQDEPGGPASAVELAAAFAGALAAAGPALWTRLRPRTVLYVHLSDAATAGVARVEGLGPAGLTQLRDWLTTALGHDTLEIHPVIDSGHQSAVETRGTGGADLDHTIPYLPRARGGPPGQTGPHNLGPLSRHHHRAKTFGHFTCHQPLPGLYLWRTPSGHWYRVDHTGTHPLGRDTPEILRQRTDPDPLTPTERHLRDLLAA